MNKEIYEHDKKGNLIHYRWGDGYECWREFDENSNVIYRKDSDGHECWKKFDENNKIIYRKRIGYKRIGYNPKTGKSFENENWYKYDKNGNKIDITKEKLEEREYLSREKVSRFELMEI